MHTLLPWLLLTPALTLLTSSAAGAFGQTPGLQDHRTWKNYGGGADNSKYVAFDKINKANVSRLRVAWTYSTGDSGSYLFNPIVVDNVMYVLAKNNSLAALDAASGKEIWIHTNLRGITLRGINYWESKDRNDGRLLFQLNNYLEEIDARTGKSILSFGKNGLVDLREGLDRDPKTITRIQSSSPGAVFENLLILGSSTGENYLAPPGDLRAYDVITGKMAWTFHTIPHPGEFGYETWPKLAWKYAGGTNTWGEISVDEKRGIAYFPTGSSTYDIYGADRVGDNLFANCLLALDARTGKRLWHFQMVHHDLWDYDATSAPQLVTVRQKGKMVDAVAQATKQGFLYVFDRSNGRPLWPIEERPVAGSDVPGEHASATQPFPTAPPPFARQKLTPDDVDPYLLTSEERASWKDRVASSRTGLFIPPSLTHETIELPGARGGSNWGTTAANPDTGIVYVLTQDWPSVFKLAVDQPAPPGSSGATSGTPSVGRTLYQDNCQLCHRPDRNGSAAAPSLVTVGSRYTLEDFKQILATGRGEMPAFPALDGAAVTALLVYLGNPNGVPQTTRVENRKPQVLLQGPIVASGGAPGGLDVPNVRPAQYGRFGGPAYPEGFEGPQNRYYSSYGLDFPYLISPPWSSIVAYDLNAGTIKWKAPLGEDEQAIHEGGKNTGMLRGGERRGMVVTSTGMVFVNCKDGKVRAFDADNGKVLWTGMLPNGSEGIPAMYELNGREYLAVSASTPVTAGRQDQAPDTNERSTEAARGYIVFSLPDDASSGR